MKCINATGFRRKSGQMGTPTFVTGAGGMVIAPLTCHRQVGSLMTKLRAVAPPRVVEVNPPLSMQVPAAEYDAEVFSLQADDVHEAVRRKHILVRGVVQGVGFRPFVYKVATSLGLSGHVFNSSSGVTIEIEGRGSALDEFLRTLKDDPPKLAEIKEITVSDVEVQGGTGFSIINSREEAGAFALVPADAGTCDECWRDFGDPVNRRFGYPFTNCTHCGPRYTIIRDIPYDRANTTMSVFTMCAECRAEYEDPGDRRFHAQPNACAVCGPSLTLLKSDVSFAERDSLAIIRETRSLLR